jgi:hypothetical protein
MFPLPPVPLGAIDEYLAAAVIILWFTISAGQMITAKLRQRRCILCNGSVHPDEQAIGVPAACHSRCHYLATLIGVAHKP